MAAELFKAWSIEKLTKAQLAGLLATVELAMPGVRDRETKDWETVHVANHHLPLPFTIAVLVAHGMAVLTQAWLGTGVLVQQVSGLRPGEMLGLKPEGVLLPREMFFGNSGAAVTNFGVKQGTKAKHEQAMLAQPDEHPIAMQCLAALTTSTPQGNYLTGGVTSDQNQRT